MNFGDLKAGQHINKCLVKMDKNCIMDVLQVTYQGNAIVVCHGTYWPTHYSENINDWLDNGYASMDYILENESKQDWNLMQNITEPVFVIQDCIRYTKSIAKQLP